MVRLQQTTTMKVNPVTRPLMLSIHSSVQCNRRPPRLKRKVSPNMVTHKLWRVRSQKAPCHSKARAAGCDWPPQASAPPDLSTLTSRSPPLALEPSTTAAIIVHLHPPIDTSYQRRQPRRAPHSDRGSSIRRVFLGLVYQAPARTHLLYHKSFVAYPQRASAPHHHPTQWRTQESAILDSILATCRGMVRTLSRGWSMDNRSVSLPILVGRASRRARQTHTSLSS